ncbi:vaculolar membrane protein [Purpureocillium lilacinum]|uniref:Vaculolar membrane protein n=1 Tax=Purpureocillium lilacinum TaxID=33203 RepID=A0A179H235_PURLI|nr:vaculolar membrane protein [Purpureocillium lilacinum]OAQ84317.1 hypothetical protein VFPBJ_03085 [Purpureocillium lilacinum]OAQ91106.1 vaculolar membrane protein [Purpureocillium lilacinum]GJN68605.1 hypothetical protein PLICBS_002648 [Purpureocillium lilacinum]GJN77719.1 hypothetical protein PLIIFM63780_001212 [Purpureocillium lilacinum]
MAINNGMATIATAAVAAATATSTTSAAGPHKDAPQGECSLLGPFALIVQAALGGLALLSLVYKRWRERPQRPLKIWFFDVSKQVFGSVLVHIANIFMSMLTSGRFSIKLEPTAARVMSRADDPYVPNPCSFYLLNLAIDTTVGIPILIVLLRIMTGLVAFTPLGKPVESIQSGNYGNPPNAWWWLKQSVIYFCGLFGMKVCVLIIFIVMPWISKVGDWALKWTEGNERLQIAFVMMIFPLIMNALQYYIIDSFIKKKDTDEHERLPSEDPDAYDEGTGLRTRGPDSDIDSDEDEDVKSVVKRPTSTAAEEYDPDVDGDAPTVIGSSSSGRIERNKVPRELFPKE